MTKPKGPLDDLKKALNIGLRVVAAAEPLVELRNIDREQREDARIESRSEPCALCRGTYRVGDDNCPKCVVVEVPGESMTCPTCAGQGKIGAKGHQVECPICKGRGKA